MSYGLRQFRAMLKLRAIARKNLEFAARALADAERARNGVLQSLDRLEAAIRTEEAVALGRTEVGFRDFAAYLAGASLKRTALHQSRQTLDAEIAALREAVLTAEIELKKFDFLTGQFEARLQKRLRKEQADVLDEAGRQRHALRRGNI